MSPLNEKEIDDVVNDERRRELSETNDQARYDMLYKSIATRIPVRQKGSRDHSIVYLA